MRRSRRLLIFVAAGLAALLILAQVLLFAVWRVDTWAEELQEESTARELAAWGKEYSSISNDSEVIKAVEVLEYMSRYYVPAQGYRGPAATEAKLAKQRQESMKQIVDALERYTGQQHGMDLDAWSKWAEEKRKSLETPPPG